MNRRIGRNAWLGSTDNTVKITGNYCSRIVDFGYTIAKATQATEAAGLTRLSSIDGLDRVGIPAYTAVRAGAEAGNLAVMGGKGVDRTAAKTSALMETIERHSGERNERQGLYRTYGKMCEQGHTLDPRHLILDKQASYAIDSPIEWWPATELHSDEAAWVPAAAVLNPYPTDPYLFSASSNGLASGNSLSEALLHALYELIERDATSFAELLGQSTAVSIKSIVEPMCVQLIQAFQDADVELHVRWIQHATGVPVYMVIVDDRLNKDPMLINAGYGCHFDSSIALVRALTEAALSRATVLAGARDNLDEDDVRRQIGYSRMREALENTVLQLKEEISFSNVASTSHASIYDDLNGVLERLEQAGFNRVYATDLTLPAIGIPVVRAIIPGMELAHVQRTRIGERLRKRFIALRDAHERAVIE